MASESENFSSQTSTVERRGDDGGGGGRGGIHQHRSTSIHRRDNRQAKQHGDNRRRGDSWERRKGDGEGKESSLRKTRNRFNPNHERKINSSFNRQRHAKAGNSSSSFRSTSTGHDRRGSHSIQSNNTIDTSNALHQPPKRKEFKKRNSNMLSSSSSHSSPSYSPGVNESEEEEEEDSMSSSPPSSLEQHQYAAASTHPHPSPSSSISPSSSSSFSFLPPYSSSRLDEAVKTCDCLDWLSLWDNMPWYVALKKVESSVLVLPLPSSSSPHSSLDQEKEEERVLFYFYKIGEKLLLKLSEDYKALISQDSEQRWLIHLTDLSSLPNSSSHSSLQDRKRRKFSKDDKKKNPSSSSSSHSDSTKDLDPFSSFSQEKKGGGEGTRGDVLSALSLLIRQQPLCSLTLLYKLLNLIHKQKVRDVLLFQKDTSRNSHSSSPRDQRRKDRKRPMLSSTRGGKSYAALEVAYDLFHGPLLLPGYRKLRSFQEQPNWLRAKVVQLLLAYEGGGENKKKRRRRRKTVKR
ncbi:cbf mak21 family protein [Cystoisospora suis]|uniref:Cbf mak21 family protein n=1 Tax=Cystoisospora suis TaxID=483139 RepID=A0A2C6KNH3_9APIC|nr:cbf mak21 family protein [Cystoisospora suis]